METYVLTKQEILLGKGTRVESSRESKPGELLCCVAHNVQAESLLNLSRILPVGGGLFFPYSLSGSPAIKQLMQMVTMVPGQGGAVSISVLPLTIPLQDGVYSGAVGSDSLRFFGFFLTCVANT